jgi:hypothetical protein
MASHSWIPRKLLSARRGREEAFYSSLILQEIQSLLKSRKRLKDRKLRREWIKRRKRRVKVRNTIGGERVRKRETS